MKNLIKSLFVLVFVSFAISASAQVKLKLGHIDSNELLKVMPGRDSATTKITDFAKMLENQLKGMQAEFETKYAEYVEMEANLTPLIKQTKQKELQDMQARIEAFSQSADSELEKKQTELLKPIIDKAKNAIEKVAKDNQFTYIFDAGVGFLLYSDATLDILPLVKKELGLN